MIFYRTHLLLLAAHAPILWLHLFLAPLSLFRLQSECSWVSVDPFTEIREPGAFLNQWELKWEQIDQPEASIAWSDPVHKLVHKFARANLRTNLWTNIWTNLWMNDQNYLSIYLIFMKCNVNQCDPHGTAANVTACKLKSFKKLQIFMKCNVHQCDPHETACKLM